MKLLEEIIISILFSLLGLVCIVANGLACYLVVAHRVIKSTFKSYVLSLAVTDILAGVVLIPTYLSLKWTTQLEYRNIRLQRTIKICLICMEIFNAVCSLLHLSLIALDRVIAVKSPIYYRSTMKKKKTVRRLLTLLWFSSLLLATLPLILRKRFYVIILQIMIFLTSVFIIVCYSTLMYRVYKYSTTLHRTNFHRKAKQIIKTTFAIVIAFTICWLPSIVLLILYATATPYPRVLRHPIKFLQYFNSTCNPFIYAIFNPTFRNGARIIATNLCGSIACRCRSTGTTFDIQSTQEEETATQI